MSELETGYDIVRRPAVGGWANSVAATVPSAQVVDFFSGAGGTSVGFASNSFGFEVLAGFEIDPISARTFSMNLDAPVVNTDISLLDPADDIESIIANLPRRDPSLPLVLIGCPPCQGFSAHTRTRPGHIDVRNTLVAGYARVIAAVKPAVAIMENVPELLKGPFSGEFVEFSRIVEDAGYVVSARVLDASKFGTPQKRKRAVVIVHTIDGWDPFSALPVDAEQRTVRDAISDLPPLTSGELSLDSMHVAVNHKQSTIDVIRAVPLNGGSRPKGIGPASLDRVTGFTDVYGRLRWDKPSVTITKYSRNPASGRFVHPEQHRGLTAREASRLQGFPDSFVFDGRRDDIYRQIGEAVPPPLGSAIATVVASTIGHMAPIEKLEGFENE